VACEASPGDDLLFGAGSIKLSPVTDFYEKDIRSGESEGRERSFSPSRGISKRSNPAPDDTYSNSKGSSEQPRPPVVSSVYPPAFELWADV